MAIKKLGAGLGTSGPRAPGLGHGAGEPRFSDGWRWTAEGWKAPAGAAPEAPPDIDAAPAPAPAQGSQAPDATARPDGLAASEPMDLFILGEPHEPDDWIISTWAAGQSAITAWSPAMVRERSDGGVELMLAPAPGDSERPAVGGEIQSVEAATTGTWTWVAEAPEMVDGAVFGMFLYKADYARDRWLEFDFEFVGGDTTRVALAVHMEDAQGRHIVNTDPVVIDLGFDAAEGLHTYQITVTGTSAVFRVDGEVVHRFSGADMPGGVWYDGALKSYVDLWAVDQGLEHWAGAWSAPSTPLVAHVAGASIEPGVVPVVATPPVAPELNRVLGGAGNDTFVGTPGADLREGRAGNDDIGGGDGDDSLLGGAGDDVLRLDRGDDRLDGGDGSDWLRIDGATGATVDLAATGRQATGYGRDTLLGIEHLWGGAGADRLLGDGGSNSVNGGSGNDALYGRSGTDTLDGGAGHDILWGGSRDRMRDVFVFSAASDTPVGRGRDVVRNFERDIDDLDLRRLDADASRAGDQAFAFAAEPAARAVWVMTGLANVMVRGDLDGDAVADFEIQVVGGSGLKATDFLL